MKAVRRPIFLADVEETADYLLSEAGQDVMLRSSAQWRCYGSFLSLDGRAPICQYRASARCS